MSINQFGVDSLGYNPKVQLDSLNSVSTMPVENIMAMQRMERWGQSRYSDWNELSDQEKRAIYQADMQGN